MCFTKGKNTNYRKEKSKHPTIRLHTRNNDFIAIFFTRTTTKMTRNNFIFMIDFQIIFIRIGKKNIFLGNGIIRSETKFFIKKNIFCNYFFPAKSHAPRTHIYNFSNPIFSFGNTINFFIFFINSIKSDNISIIIGICGNNFFKKIWKNLQIRIANPSNLAMTSQNRMISIFGKSFFTNFWQIKHIFFTKILQKSLIGNLMSKDNFDIFTGKLRKF